MIKAVTLVELMAYPTFQALVGKYAEECRMTGLPAPNPDFEQYQAMEDAGAMRAVVAELDGVLVGFSVLLIARVAHYSTTIAVTESLYVDSDHRGRPIGGKLLRGVERLAEELGADGLFVSAPANGMLEVAMRGTKGYTHSNTVFFKSFLACLG